MVSNITVRISSYHCKSGVTVSLPINYVWSHKPRVSAYWILRAFWVLGTPPWLCSWTSLLDFWHQTLYTASSFFNSCTWNVGLQLTQANRSNDYVDDANGYSWRMGIVRKLAVITARLPAGHVKEALSTAVLLHVSTWQHLFITRVCNHNNVQ